MPPVDITKLSDEELIAKQQGIMKARGEAEAKFKADAHDIQFELDKRAAMQRLGPVGPAELAALQALAAESEAAQNG